jgi:uncharacterized protein YciI
MRSKQLFPLLLLALPLFSPCAAAQENPPREVMYMVSRWHIPNVASKVTPELDRAHKDHIKEFSVSVTSANMLSPEGKVIGVVSIKGFPTLEQARKYVYEDPFTKAGLYSRIELQPIDLYVLNGAFARAPEWVIAERPEERWKYTPAKPPAAATAAPPATQRAPQPARIQP